MLYTIDEFLEECMEGYLIDYDGVGYYTNSRYDATYEKEAYPSDFVKGNIDRSYKYVLWFNR